MITIAGVDPGLATGGLVHLTGKPAEERVLDALSIVTRKKSDPSDRDRNVDPQFSDATRRSELWVTKAVDRLLTWKPDAIAIESFTDQESRAKRRNSKTGDIQFDRNRWMTPLVIGRLHAELLKAGFDEEQIFYQNPAILSARNFGTEIRLLDQANERSRRRTEQVLLAGDELLRNQHLVRAWCHGSWRRDRFPVTV